MTDASFIHLRVHTAYSLLEGALKIPRLIDLVKKHQMPAVAITDTANLFGALEFSQACAKAGIQPIVGTQVKVAMTHHAVDLRTLPSVVLLVQNEKGYQNLLTLMRLIYTSTNAQGVPYISFDQLKENSEGLICLSGGVDGPIGQALLSHKMTDADRITQTFQQTFGNRFYIEIMRHGLKEEQKTEEAFLDLAYLHNIPIVATNEAFFEDKSMHEAHDALLCIAEGRYVLEEDRRRVTPHHSFKSSDEMVELFKDLPEAIQNTQFISKRCAYMPLPHAPMLPGFPCDENRTEEEELKAQALQGLQHRLETEVFTKDHAVAEKETLSKQYHDRLAYELGIINQMGFPGYFLIVADFIKWAKREGIPVGPGRGSGAGSLVAWSLTITDVDPIRFNLIFERFLNPERVSMPDFDVDFCQDRRDEVIAYVQKRYGSDHVAQIITFGKLQARAVLRDVGRVLQIPYGQVDKLCKLVPNNPANPCTLEEALVQEPELQRAREEDETVSRLIDIALKLEGLYRHASTHAAGIIIGDRPLDQLIPLYRDPKSDMLVTQFSMKYVEMAGLVKFDFLGLKTLTILEKAAEMARSRGSDVEISTLPLDDAKTFELLRNVQTTGVFQLEGQGMRDVLRRLKPDRFEEIIALVALYRPGPMDDIPRYLACKHGEEQVHYMHESFEPILKETFGVMVYQEQVMQIAQVLSGYSLGGADLLRRAMGKKIKSEMDAQRKIFVDGAKEKGVAESLSNEIFDQVAKFAGYGFNKSHSAPYGLIAYQTAYMKANFPEEFMAATMTYDLHNTDKLAFYREELASMGIPLLPPDINCSKPQFSVEIDSETGKKAIRYALAALKNVGVAAMEEVSAETAKAPFKDLDDFLSRLSSKVLNKRQMESLISAGAFDTLHNDRAQLMASLESLLKYASSLQQEKDSLQHSLFGDLMGPKAALPLATTFDKWSLLEKAQKEQDAIGFYLFAHPLSTYQETLDRLGVVSSADIEKRGRHTSALMLAGVPTSVKTRLSKKGKRFAFVTFSDAVGSFETVLFEETLHEARPLLETNEPLLVSVGVRFDDDGSYRLMANRLRSLSERVESIPKKICLTLEEGPALDEALALLKIHRGGHDNISFALKGESMIHIDLPGSFKVDAETIDQLGTFAGIKVTVEEG
jgi:DNA polymerase-3 subunit alpha